MNYFSGFGLQREWPLFADILERSDFCICGFSYGAQKALQEAIKRVENGKRVEKLQLISPAYFAHLSKEAKHKEIVAFAKNPKTYLKLFYKRVVYPSSFDIVPFKKEPTLSELKELLLYEWRVEDLAFLQESGVKIEVYLGSEDKIVNPVLARKFFSSFAQVYSIKSVGHILR